MPRLCGRRANKSPADRFFEELRDEVATESRKIEEIGKTKLSGTLLYFNFIMYIICSSRKCSAQRYAIPKCPSETDGVGCARLSFWVD